MRTSRLAGVGVALVLCACGGRARVEGTGGGPSDIDPSGAGSTVGGAGSSAGGESPSAGGATAACPSDEPNEDAACAPSGQRCPGYGSLSCPETALCVSGKWQINCPATMFGGVGVCGCPHHTFGEVPLEHRALAAVCSEGRAPGNALSCDTDAGGPCLNAECTQDAQCAAGKNGRCVQTGRQPEPACSYDECVADSDCGKGSVCHCRDAAHSSEATYCTKASNCRTDADCGADGYCSPSSAHDWCDVFYACHTAQDECVNDSDCVAGAHCNFDVSLQHWACGSCGVRPP